MHSKLSGDVLKKLLHRFQYFTNSDLERLFEKYGCNTAPLAGTDWWESPGQWETGLEHMTWLNPCLDRTTMIEYLLRLRSFVQVPATILLGLFKRRVPVVRLVGNDIIQFIARTVVADWINNEQGWTLIRKALQIEYQKGKQQYLEMKAINAARQSMQRYGSRYLTKQEEEDVIHQFRNKQKKDSAAKVAAAN